MNHESELLVRDRWYALIVAGPSGSGKSIVAGNVTENLYERHMRPLFIG